MRSFSGLIETMRGGAPSFPMKFNIRRAIVAVSLVASAPFASATVLNFDDLAGGGFMPVYQGFTFNGWFHNAFTGTPHLAKSPEQAIHLDSSVPANSK